MTQIIFEVKKMKLTLKNLTNDEKKFYNSLVKTVGKDSLSDIARHGCGGGYPGITYYDDILSFIKRNKTFICDLIQNDIIEGVLVRSQYSLFRDKLDDEDTIEVDSFIFLGRLPKNGQAISFIGWYAIESFIFRLIDCQ
jgi:hypothetical protein